MGFDHTGKKYNKLLVLKFVKKVKTNSYWDCLCDCGNRVVVSGSHFRNGHTKSCGCIFRDTVAEKTQKRFVGKRFNRWFVLGVCKDRRGYFNCVCDCGKTGVIFGGSLVKQTSKSCGCLKVERVSLPSGEAAFNRLFDSYRRGALTRGLEFLLTKEYFKSLTIQNCFYCGLEPNGTVKATDNSQKVNFYTYSGVDRVNSSLGYTMENCVPCCAQCNQAKSDFSTEEFLSWVKRVYLFQNKTIKET